MNNLIKNDIVKELNSKELKSIDGGNWLTEGIAFIAGVVHGVATKFEHEQTEEEYWSQMRVLAGG